MWLRAFTLVALLCSIACGAREDLPSDHRDPAAAPKSSPAPARAATPTDQPRPSRVAGRPRIVALGDSLTAGLGLPVDQAYPAVLQQRLKNEGFDYEVVNAGVSGDTSAGGLSRLDWSLDGDVRILIVALGGNDALRGLPAEQLKRNLAEIIERARARGITVVLAGMEAPPNYGRPYTVAFHQVYPALARQYRVGFVPFLLQGVAGVRALNQPDGIHPTAQGARIVADNVWAALKPIVEGQPTRD